MADPDCAKGEGRISMGLFFGRRHINVGTFHLSRSRPNMGKMDVNKLPSQKSYEFGPCSPFIRAASQHFGKLVS